MAGSSNPDDEAFLQSIDCDVIADLLHIHGEALRRICPKCRNQSLVLSADGFRCTHCYVEGDPVDLVCLKRRCSHSEAVAWLKKQSDTATKKRSGGSGIAGVPSFRNPEESGIAEILPLNDGPDGSVLSAVSDETAFGTLSGGPNVVMDLADVNDAYLTECRELPKKLEQVLKIWKLDLDTCRHFGVRYYIHDQETVLDNLKKRFGFQRVVRAGLYKSPHTQLVSGGDDDWEIGSGSIPDVGSGLSQSTSGLSGSSPGSGPLVAAFEGYHRANFAYVVLPYILDGRPVYLKALPLVDNRRLEPAGLPPSLATGDAEPCLFNIDKIVDSEKVVLFRREVDAMAACSIGYAGGAFASLTRFRAAWARAFRGKEVFIVLSPGNARDGRLKDLERTFLEAGASSFKVITRKREVAFEDMLKQEVGEPSGDSFMPDLHLEKSGGSPAKKEDAKSRSGGVPTKSSSGLIAESPESWDSGEQGGDRPDAPLPMEAADHAPAGKLGKAGGTFIAAVAGGRRRMIVIDRIERGGDQFARLRYWLQKRGTHEWYVEDRLTFVLPLSAIDTTITALQGAEQGSATTDMPDWLRESGEY